jgi:hypothetical protein
MCRGKFFTEGTELLTYTRKHSTSCKALAENPGKQTAQQPNKGKHKGENGTTKNQTLHQSHEANQPKKERRDNKPNKTLSLEESSPAGTASLMMVSRWRWPEVM